MGNQETHRLAIGHHDFERQPLRIILGFGKHLHRAATVLIDPTARITGHHEDRWHIQQVPSVAGIHEYPLAVAAEQAEVTMAGGDEAVDAHMALGDHRVEHAGHPCSGSEGGFIRHERPAGAQQCAVRAQHREFLGLEHHMAVLLSEERPQPAVFPFLVTAFIHWKYRKYMLVRFVDFQQWRGGEPRSSRLVFLHIRPCGNFRLRQCQGAVDEVRIRFACRGRLVRLEPREKSALLPLAGLECEPLLLDGGHRMLVLQALAGQAGCKADGLLSGPGGIPMKLHRIRGERNRAPERAA